MCENNGTASLNPQSTENMTLEIANKIFSQSGYEILSEFKAVAENSFLSGAEELDFADGEGSRNIINSWVEKKTRNRIKDLIPSGKHVLFLLYITNYVVPEPEVSSPYLQEPTTSPYPEATESTPHTHTHPHPASLRSF
jgi:hypothetical protein